MGLLESLTKTDWILIGGFTVVIYQLADIQQGIHTIKDSVKSLHPRWIERDSL